MERMTLETGMRQNGKPFSGLDFNQVSVSGFSQHANPTIERREDRIESVGAVGHKDKDERLGVRTTGHQSGKRIIAGTLGNTVVDV